MEKPLDARVYLIDAERLIRLRGLAKQKFSRKARLLHHTYTWFRILGESSYVLHDYVEAEAYQDTASNLRPSFEQERVPHRLPYAAREADKLDDFLRNQTQGTQSDAENEGPMEAEVALHNIHLEDPRVNPHTLYNRIFGIAETWLGLVSQTTRLANILDATKASKEGIVSPNNFMLQSKASRLEDTICSFVSNFQPSGAMLSRHLHQALNAALVIFFYRRIRNTNALILQSYVDDVLRALQDYSLEADQIGQQWWSSTWPVVIAGSEAITSDRRDQFLHWIHRSEEQTGFDCKAVKEVLHELWRRSDGTTGRLGRECQPARTSASWIDLCRERGVWLIPCR